MKPKDILYAMTHIRDAHVEDAAPRTARASRRAWIKWTAAAACLCLCAGAVLAIAPWKREPAPVGVIVSEDGVTIPPMEVKLDRDRGAMTDMIGFFIYDGRCYVQYETVYDPALVGEYVGTSNGLIDEWTPKDGYVDLAGSISGNFYTVSGFDPSFMLCMPMEGELVSLFVNNNGMTLKTGADLFEERLHVRGNIAHVRAESRNSWFHTELLDFELAETYREELDAFVDALYVSPFVPSADVPPSGEMSELYFEMEIYHLYLYLGESASVPVHLRLFEGGYVMLKSIREVCVYMPGDAFDDLVRVLDALAAKYEGAAATVTTS